MKHLQGLNLKNKGINKCFKYRILNIYKNLTDDESSRILLVSIKATNSIVIKEIS